MSDKIDWTDRPLRQEDYQIMAEELRRAQEENVKLKNRKPFPWTSALKYFGIGLAVAGGLTLFIAAITAAVKGCAEQAEYDRTHPQQARASHPCYFVRHHLMDDDGYPWEKWHVYISKCSEGCNERVDLEPDKHDVVEPTFDSKDAAWDWATNKWHLNMCN